MGHSEDSQRAHTDGSRLDVHGHIIDISQLKSKDMHQSAETVSCWVPNTNPNSDYDQSVLYNTYDQSACQQLVLFFNRTVCQI